ncbi:MAG: hypothetical protein AB1486_32320, partial [Planctomycetota bacterium]
DRQPRTAFTATSDADRAFAAERRLDRQLTPSTQATTILTPTGRRATGRASTMRSGHTISVVEGRLPEWGIPSHPSRERRKA